MLKMLEPQTQDGATPLRKMLFPFWEKLFLITTAKSKSFIFQMMRLVNFPLHTKTIVDHLIFKRDFRNAKPFLLFLPLLCQNVEGARKKRVLNEETEQVQQEPTGPVLEIAEDRKMGERGRYSLLFMMLSTKRNRDAVTGLLEILDNSDSNVQKYHGEAQGILINLLSGMNLPYLSLVEQKSCTKRRCSRHHPFSIQHFTMLNFLVLQTCCSIFLFLLKVS